MEPSSPLNKTQPQTYHLLKPHWWLQWIPIQWNNNKWKDFIFSVPVHPLDELRELSHATHSSMGRDTRAVAKEALCLGRIDLVVPESTAGVLLKLAPLYGNLFWECSPTEGTQSTHPTHTLWNPQLRVYLIGLLVASHHAHGLYEGVARVVHSGLDALVQGIAAGRHLVAELGVDGRREALGHAVVVFAQVRVVCTVRRGERRSASSPAGTGPIQELCFWPGSLQPGGRGKLARSWLKKAGF